ncbi:MAG TPA: RagB/SusD family nutrient uptake outer membrane protein, partial [Bacteroidales bacterium]|nr:RagB/SusD family nutrient uptake outer membrane protein [Bacteroidales bacterium]
PRLDATIGRDGVEWLNGAPFQASWSPSGYLTKKHQQPLTEVSITFKGDGDLDYIYLRYADVLLMKSEAFNEIGNVDSSLANLNKVRTRARNSIAGEIPTDLLNPVIERGQSALRKIIQHERRVELGQEFHRYFDLMRWGKQVAESALGSS